MTKNKDFHPLYDGAWQHETRAYWVKTPNGRRLGLYQRDHQPIPDTAAAGCPPGTSPKAVVTMTGSSRS